MVTTVTKVMVVMVVLVVMVVMVGLVVMVVTELRYDLLETKVILWWKIYRNANNGFYVSMR